MRSLAPADVIKNARFLPGIPGLLLVRFLGQTRLIFVRAQSASKEIPPPHLLRKASAYTQDRLPAQAALLLPGLMFISF